MDVSYLEIYNEVLKDLLDPKEKDLKIFSTKQGTFVKNLEKIRANSFKEVDALLTQGKKMRVVGATQMNKTSSRSHAVFTLYLEQKIVKEGKKTIKRAEINIVDLAGSER